MATATNKNDEPPKKRIKEDEGRPEWFKEVLECPVCFELIRDPPIFLCDGTIGHSLCKACYLPLADKNMPCPICREKLSKKRSNLLEKLVESLPKACCKFQACSYQNSDLQMLKKHEEDQCAHRKIPCGHCHETFSLSKFHDHNFQHQKKKEDPLHFGQEKCYRHIRNNWAVVASQYIVDILPAANRDNHSFLLNWTTHQNWLIFWVSNCGPKEEAKQYEFSIEVKNRKGEKVYSGARRCVPCDISHEKMKELGCGLIIDRATLQESHDCNDHALCFITCVKIDKRN